jgi:D-alanyl-D-alanine carboxypeptidase (penicillin-binding protein 5/6)
MRKLRKVLAAVAAALAFSACGATVGVATAPNSRADSMQPIGSVPIPDGPAQTWIVADLDSGQVLAGRDQDVPHPPASTIKVLLALVALDQVSLDSTVVADASDTESSATVSASNPAGRTRRANCSTPCCWSRATTPPTRWHTCWAARTPPWR